MKFNIDNIFFVQLFIIAERKLLYHVRDDIYRYQQSYVPYKFIAGYQIVEEGVFGDNLKFKDIATGTVYSALENSSPKGSIGYDASCNIIPVTAAIDFTDIKRNICSKRKVLKRINTVTQLVNKERYEKEKNDKEKE